MSLRSRDVSKKSSGPARIRIGDAANNFDGMSNF